MKTTRSDRHTASRQALLLMLMLLTSIHLQAARVGVYCYMAAEGSHVYADRNIRATLVLTPDGTALLEVSNLTDSIIYVDRGNSFAYVNGDSEPFFIPSANTESSGFVQGIITDDGWDTASFSGYSQGQSHTIFDRRTQPIAPHGRAIVYAWDNLPRFLSPHMVSTDYHGRGNSCRKGMFLTGSTAVINGDPTIFVPDNGAKFRKGLRRDYAPDATPLTLAADMQYGFIDPTTPVYNLTAETPAQPIRASLSDYVASIVIGGSDGVSKRGVLTNQTTASSHCFAFRSGKDHAATIGGWAAVAGLVVLMATISPDMPDSDPNFPF
ncbi:MAG: hypothetical protein IJV36_05280 [Prevotella sp.]|nr:hypothetical protein [Prevotella sp.]